jgi:hypothetical protein
MLKLQSRLHDGLTLAGHVHTALWIGGGAMMAVSGSVAQRLLHIAVEWSAYAVVFVTGAIMFFGAKWIEKHASKASAGRTADELKSCVATLAGNLFSFLFEIGEKLDAPAMTSEQHGKSLFGDHPPDPRITSRASERKIADHLKEAYSCADDLGVLPGVVSWSTAIGDVEDVRSRISDLRILREALARRFPDHPPGGGSLGGAR